MLLNWIILQIIYFLRYVGECQIAQHYKGLPSSWSQNWHGFMNFVEKHWRGCLSHLFTSAIGLATSFSPLSLSLSIAELIQRVNKQTQPTSQDQCNWIHSSKLAAKKLCHCNHTICSVFKWVKRRRISLHYQNHLFCPKCCMLSMLYTGNKLSFTAPAKLNSQKSGI